MGNRSDWYCVLRVRRGNSNVFILAHDAAFNLWLLVIDAPVEVFYVAIAHSAHEHCQ